MNSQLTNSEYLGDPMGTSPMGTSPMDTSKINEGQAGEDRIEAEPQGDRPDETAQLRQEIEATQSRLSDDVAALSEEATPASMARRGGRHLGEHLAAAKDRMGTTASDVKGRVGEAAGEAKDRVGATASQVKGRVGEAAGEVKARMSEAGSTSVSKVRETSRRMTRAAAATPGMVTRSTRDNPIAVGLIVFGLGWLAGSLMPVGRKARQMSEQLVERAAPKASEMASEVADQARQNLAEAVAPKGTTVTRG